ncbi:MAG: hypothetical protein QOH72_3630 [Solirubrobacteraceae bacterium]|jgi:uncharacterized protein YbcI|nr:hypothetical protein [Solirubrobacteraceae bacterium]
MSGFTFRYRLSGKPPTVQGFVFDPPATLGRGDLLNLRSGVVELGKTGDTALVGAALERRDGDASQTSIPAIVDADAVYGVEDPRSRLKGSTLDLDGDSGAQRVSAGVNHDFVVDVDSREGDETLVRIAAVNHYAAPEVSAVQAEGLVGGALNAAIARTIVRYHAEQLGRGPTKAQAFHRDNLIVIVLEDTMTRAERTLVASGGTDAVLHTRRAFQDSLAPYLRSAIERLTGCTVRAFMSANHLDPDLAGEMFVLDRAVPGQPAHAGGADDVD